MPSVMRHNISHPKFNEFRIVVSTCLVGLPLMLLFPIPVYLLDKSVTGYLLNDALVIITLLCTRFFGHYRIPMTVTALVTYFIIYNWIKGTGMIYSPYVSVLHMYLLCAIWADKRYGWLAIFSNIAILIFTYYYTLTTYEQLGDRLHALIMNLLITVFFGGFLSYLQFDQERDRIKIKMLQEKKITVLDNAIKARTKQLNSMRETLATDFHDETGNMLSAIIRQANILKNTMDVHDEKYSIIESLIRNSNNLYGASKDFLWHLNYDSDDPNELFTYLTAYGQQYYNQFDIAFSSKAENSIPLQLLPNASLNIIYILKEAMTNTVKHSGGNEVTFKMNYNKEKIYYSLIDNGKWKISNTDHSHYGISNMRKRCIKNGIILHIDNEEGGTRITLDINAQLIMKT